MPVGWQQQAAAAARPPPGVLTQVADLPRLAARHLGGVELGPGSHAPPEGRQQPGGGPASDGTGCQHRCCTAAARLVSAGR